nr:PEP/pyruvate-binding domain-containing protein [Anaerolineae bacterium]
MDPQAMPKVLQLYLELSQYPILSGRIRERMRAELFARGVVSQQDFEQEIREKSLLSQEREGYDDPYSQEPADQWQDRLNAIRDNLTDFYFAYNLPHDLFEDIVREVVARRRPEQPVILSFNPEMAPWDLLFWQGESYENQPPEQRVHVQHHLREIIVVLIKSMISDQLSFVRVAREYFTVKDLMAIRSRRIGRGKIGGKAAGMLLAYKILERRGPQRGLDIERLLSIPESWYIASDVFYDFQQENDLFRFMNQKYKRPEQMRADYPQTYNAYLNSRLPTEIQQQLAGMLERVGRAPLIVRSSSQLEDNFETSFAGKYDSFFVPNQGSPEENLRSLLTAIIRVYASVLRPEALIYREQMHLTDYDERMGILIQKVEGRPAGRYFFPDFAGVAFSHSPYVWSKRIDRDAGLVRLVAGLGTRAVDRVGNDYPRMVALSHPTLRPDIDAHRIRRYSQHQMDVIDLEENEVASVPFQAVMDLAYPALGAVISLEQDGYVQALSSQPIRLDPDRMVLTFDNLLAADEFAGVMRETLSILEEAYGRPVDIEFAGKIVAALPRPQFKITLLQCRTLSRRKDGKLTSIPDNIPEEDILFTANQGVPGGCVEGIRYIVYVDPLAYAHIPDPQTRLEIGHVVGRLNNALAKESFILMGPGRWGTSTIQLGVKVSYVDIYNTKVLIEVAYTHQGNVPEVSYGTHFYQDLVEANIYPLPLYPDDPVVVFREDFFRTSPNQLAAILPADERFSPYIRVIDVPSVSDGRGLTVIMNSEEDRAVAYFCGECECPVED